jgi:sugar lactone lactonase YvrE
MMTRCLLAWAICLMLVESPTISSPVGNGRQGYSGDGGPAKEASLNQPFGVVFDEAGNLFVSDTFNHRVRRVDARTGVISTVAGTGERGFSGDGGPATAGNLNEPYGLAVDSEGNLYIADRLNHRVRKVDAKGQVITTVAGSDSRTPTQNGGTATDLTLLDAGGIALDGAGHLLIADVSAHRIWSLDVATGQVTPFAGTGRKEHVGDGGPAVKASLFGPRAVAVRRDRTVVIVEREGNRVCTVDPETGLLKTIAGTGKKGYSGDGGLASDATFNGPKELTVDPAGNTYIVDTENNVIRKIDAKIGTIRTVAGHGAKGGAGDSGPAIAAELDRPHGVVIGRDGSIWIGDTNNHRIRKVGRE